VRICGASQLPDEELGVGSWRPASQRADHWFWYFARKDMGGKGRE